MEVGFDFAGLDDEGGVAEVGGDVGEADDFFGVELVAGDVGVGAADAAVAAVLGADVSGFDEAAHGDGTSAVAVLDGAGGVVEGA